MSETSSNQSSQLSEQQPDRPKQKGLRPLERVMLMMAGFYVAGVLIFGFLTGPVRVIAMTIFVCAFTYFLFSPICTRDRISKDAPKPPNKLN